MITEIEIPKVFWKYYDQYRRNKLNLVNFSEKANLSTDQILTFLKEINKIEKTDENSAWL